LKESQRTSGVAFIVAQLGRELFGSGEFAGFAKSGDEIDANVRAIKIAFGVEQVRFERRRRVPERGTRTKVHHPAKRTGGCLGPHSVYTFGRKKLPVGGRAEVQGWEPDGPTTLSSLDDAAAHRIEAPQTCLRPIEIATGYGAPD
jgi:hypothetical protein